LTLLKRLQSAGLPVPEPYFVDETVFDRPCIVVAFVDGMTEFSPANLSDYIEQMAAALARIHSISGDTPELAFLPRLDALAAKKIGTRPAALDEPIGEGRIRDALEAAYPFPGANAPALLHGDYWAGNILWKAGQLAAVIDWEDARVGDPLADLGSSRLETLWAFGVKAMRDFTRRYLALRPLDTTSLPYWDLYAALRPAHQLSLWAEGSAERERHFREGHAQFVAQAFEVLKSHP
jgi:aminoglycoside phosphotransferase (APT) family kinase protein